MSFDFDALPDDPHSTGTVLVYEEWTAGKRKTWPAGGRSITTPTHIDGRGSLIRVARGDVAFTIEHAALGTIIENVHIEFGAKPYGHPDPANQYHDGVGIDIKTNGVTLRNVTISYPGTGIRLLSGGGVNCNGIKTEGKCKIQGAWDYGVYTDGPDANAGDLTGLDLNNCRIGIRESSQLGNTYNTPQIHGPLHNGVDDQTNIIVEGDGNYSTFIGAYTEASSPGTLPQDEKLDREIRSPANLQHPAHNATFFGGNVAQKTHTAGVRVSVKSMIRFMNAEGAGLTIPPAGAGNFMALTANIPYTKSYTLGWKDRTYHRKLALRAGGYVEPDVTLAVEDK